MRSIIFLLAIVAVVSAKPPLDRYQTPNNVAMVWCDTMYIDSTETEWSDIFWQADGASKVLLVEAADTNEAGFADDSAAVGIEMYQAFNDPFRASGVYLVKSRAFPDSASWAYSPDFFIADSLDIEDLDTTTYYERVGIPLTNLNGDTTGWTYSKVVDSLSDNACAIGYYPIVPDATPGIAFKLTGKASNAIRGGGSRWILKIFQISGQTVKIREN